MENPQADSSAGKAVDSTAAGGSGRTTPGWNGLSGQNTDEVSRLARAALQNTALFGGNAAGGQGADAATSAASLLDPLGNSQLTSDQLAAVLASSGYTAASLGSLGMSGLQPADNAAALNALLLSGGLGLNQLTAQGLLNPDLSALGALMGGDGGGDMDEHGGGGKQAGMNVTSNKQLSSRFRGVCWNKKNKRWQAAINSSGKYLYLGSFTNEDEAARQFDKAAIKLRGKKAKLNFDYADYVDENGELIDEIILPQGATGGKDDARGSAGGARRGSKSAAADASGLDMSGLSPDLVNQAAIAALMQQGAWQGIGRSGKTAVVAPPLALEKEQVSVLLPPGCSLEYIVPVNDAAAAAAGGSGGGSSSGRTLFGVVYKDNSSGLFGAGVWTGYMFKAFGHYGSEDAAVQTARCAGEVLSEDRDLRVSGGVANQQGMGLMGPAGLLAGPGGAAFPQDALALAGLAGLGGAAGGGGGRGTVGGNGSGSMAAGLLGMPAGLVGGMGSLANVSLAQAAQLAQQAAAEQGLPMSYPPLSVALPVVSTALQLMPGGVGGAGAAGAGDMQLGGLDAAVKASSEAEMQQLMQQLMQQQQQQQQGAPDGQQRQQLLAAPQLGPGSDTYLKLANLDMAQLRQQLMEQQHGVGAAAADGQQQEVLGSIPGLDTVGKRQLELAAGGADAAGAAGDLLAQAGVAELEAAAAAAAGDAEGPSAKRARTDAGSGAEAAAAAAAAAAGAAAPMGLLGAGAGTGEMVQMDLRDALKMLQSVQQQASALE